MDDGLEAACQAKLPEVLQHACITLDCKSSVMFRYWDHHRTRGHPDPMQAAIDQIVKGRQG